MRVSGLVLMWVLFTGASGCNPGQYPVAGDQLADDALDVKLQGVIARQYAGPQLMFEVRMGSLVLYSKRGRMDAHGQIRGVLFEPLWKNEN